MGDIIRFRLLGPLEVQGKRQREGLGGTKQKATLAYLLLHANRVVSISQLLNALWPADSAPLSARKILQNSVSSLRRGPVPGDRADGTPTLVTQAPGYKLCVDREDIDLHVFHDRVAEGRRRLADNEPEPAARVLREALALWRGPVLADLAEAGISWLELAVLQNARWDATEDHFEAELACGRHLAVLGDLEAMVETNPVRERAAGQLMLALYRSGRQADALNTYSRVRVALVEELGLEPGRELRALQQSILAHDPLLLAPRGSARVPLRGHTGTPVDLAAARTPDQARFAGGDTVPLLDAPQPSQLSPWLPTGPAPHTVPDPWPAPPHRHPVPGNGQPGNGQPVPEPAAPRPADEVPPAREERKTVSVLLVRTVIDDGQDGANTPGVDRMLAEIAQLVRANAEHFAGIVSATIGSVSLTVFEPGSSGWVDAAKRAVLAALAIGEDLRPDADARERPPVSFHAAVVTGEVLVRHPAGGRGPITLTGTLLDRCHTLLLRTGVSEIRVCEATREATEPLAVYQPGDVHDHRLQGIRKDFVGATPGLAAEREFEIGLLLGMLERTRLRSAAHLVTLLGDRGTGKTRLLDEFEERAHGQAHIARFQVSRRPTGATGVDIDAIHDLQRELIHTICAIAPGDEPTAAMAKASAVINRLIDDPVRVQALLTCIAPYLDPELAFVMNDPVAELRAWQRFLAMTEFSRPFVLIVDDLHRADESLLDFVGELADAACGPLLVVASARSELLGRRPTWGGGKRHVTTITLEALGDAAVDELVGHLVSSAQPGRTREPARFSPARADDESGPRQPGWRRYFRSLLDIGTPQRAPRPRSAELEAVARLRSCGSATTAEVSPVRA
ncbi:BTAD domain-containing putative transcriptional regulator [Actinosynnema sp. NPDC047251]|uniref:Transcriptional regulator, SARP family n=1 Tax=Saccharothrix espanaensis (strain ATCC 51144 / DSM 44229 / JCM 9112 / NBRC 15066 / NRRL 15764) TaxID=1179773 RepID=K0K1B6_SACES|nr:BTAD domain-containing putative transcriptional regulator [Saccharothrix espanaensis]CCH32111.1 Transcriptional regulator, SARP family [Saccharothrix espanaensis DSM 44229]